MWRQQQLAAGVSVSAELLRCGAAGWWIERRREGAGSSSPSSLATGAYYESDPSDGWVGMDSEMSRLLGVQAAAALQKLRFLFDEEDLDGHQAIQSLFNS